MGIAYNRKGSGGSFSMRCVLCIRYSNRRYYNYHTNETEPIIPFLGTHEY